MTFVTVTFSVPVDDEPTAVTLIREALESQPYDWSVGEPPGPVGGVEHEATYAVEVRSGSWTDAAVSTMTRQLLAATEPDEHGYVAEVNPYDVVCLGDEVLREYGVYEPASDYDIDRISDMFYSERGELCYRGILNITDPDGFRETAQWVIDHLTGG